MFLCLPVLVPMPVLVQCQASASAIPIPLPLYVQVSVPVPMLVAEPVPVLVPLSVTVSKQDLPSQPIKVPTNRIQRHPAMISSTYIRNIERMRERAIEKAICKCPRKSGN